MTRKILIACSIALAASTFGVGKAEAGFIELTSYAAPLQPTNTGEATLEAWLASAVTGYNAINNPDLPASTGEVFRNVNDNTSNWPGFPAFGVDVTNLQIPVAGFEYLVLHWGGPDAPCNTNQGCAALNYQAIYIGDPGQGVTYYTADNSVDGNGLSGYMLYNPTSVPDGGMTLMLLGGALVGLGALRRKFSV
jgi:hypothetical protein